MPAGITNDKFTLVLKPKVIETPVPVAVAFADIVIVDPVALTTVVPVGMPVPVIIIPDVIPEIEEADVIVFVLIVVFPLILILVFETFIACDGAPKIKLLLRSVYPQTIWYDTFVPVAGLYSE